MKATYDDLEGPDGYKIWNKFLTAPTSDQWSECMLFSDSSVPGEILEGLGPYQFICGIAEDRGLGHATPTQCLRTTYPDAEWGVRMMGSKSQEEFYHGGGYTEELASLMGLILGIRLKAGPENRMSSANDPKGHPLYIHDSQRPTLSPKFRTRASLPNAHKIASLRDHDFVSLIYSYPKLTPKDAIALVRATRLYQEALWIAESDPSTTWLFLVSAVETAAHHWKKKSEKSETLFRSHYPDLTISILEHGNAALLTLVANEFASTTKATDKFLKFSLHFMPEAPPKRAQFGLQSWTTEDLTNTLSTIYKLRSNALHSGKPFPYYMNEAPMNFDGMLTEAVAGLKVDSYGDWKGDSMPLLLNTYEYMVRQSLLKWWSSMVSKN